MQRRKTLKPRVVVHWEEGVHKREKTAQFTGWNASVRAKSFRDHLAFRRGVHSITTRRLA